MKPAMHSGEARRPGPRAAIYCAVCLGWIGAAQAQIQVLAVVNSASYQAGLPETGALATIFCTGLSGIPGVVSAATDSPLPLALADVHVTVNGGAAPILAVADLGGGLQQINIQAPPERLLAQKSTVVVSRNGSSGKVDGVDYPGVGGFFSGGRDSAIAVRLSDGTAVTPQNPAQAGDSIAVYGTGFGPTYPPKPVGFPAPGAPAFQGTMDFTEPGAGYNISMPARQLTLGSKVAHVSFAGIAAGLAGVDQIVFQVPDGLGAGTLPLRLSAGVISCMPPPFAQSCTFQARISSNTVLVPLR